MTISSLIKVAAYSNPTTAAVMLSATTIQIPVAIIASVKKYLGQAKDFLINNTPIGVQLAILAVAGYYISNTSSKVGHYIFDMPKATQSLQDSINLSDLPEENKKNLEQVTINMRYNTEAREALAQTNEKGENPLQQAAEQANVEAVQIMLEGPHDGIIATAIDLAKHPVLNGADVLVNVTNAVLNKVSPKLGDMLPDRTINSGATAEEINHADNNGQTLLHIEAEKFTTAKGLQVITTTVKKGGDLGKQDNEGNTPLVKGLENTALTNAVKPTAVVKALTENGKQLTKAAAPIAQNADKAELIKPVVEFAQQQNGYIFGRDNAEKLLAGTLTNAVKAKNIAVVKELIPTVNNLPTADQVKTAMPELTKEIEVREEAIANPCNENPLKIAATGARDNGIKLTDVKNYIENETVPTSHKVLAAVAVLPSAQNMVNEAIIETAVSATSKVIGWAGDFLAAVGEELGKGITQESITDIFSASTAQDHAAAHTYTPKINIGSPNTWMIQNFSQPLAITGAENMGFDANEFALDCASLD